MREFQVTVLQCESSQGTITGIKFFLCSEIIPISHPFPDRPTLVSIGDVIRITDQSQNISVVIRVQFFEVDTVNYRINCLGLIQEMLPETKNFDWDQLLKEC